MKENYIKQKTGNILLIVMLSLPFVNIGNTNAQSNTGLSLDTTKIEARQETISRSKKDIKKEIKKRKRYHKFLIKEYKKDMLNESILMMIKENSEKITILQKEINK